MTDSKDASVHGSSVAASNTEESTREQPRRNFLFKFVTVLIGGIVSAFGVIVGLIVFFDPLARKPKTPKLFQSEDRAAEGYIRVASEEAIPKDGTPMRFPVIADLIDAWNFTPDQPIGAVYVRRDPQSGELVVFHATCPHAGCSVSYAADARQFLCPCHNSSFGLDGGKVSLPGKENPSPRPMDVLEHTVEDGAILVKFENYYTGIEEKKPKI